MSAVGLLRVLTCAVACWLVAAGTSLAESDPLILTYSGHESTVSQHIQFLRDPTGQRSVSDVLNGTAGEFRYLPGKSINFDFTQDTIWLRLPVINRADRAHTWFLATNTNFLHHLEAYLVRDGRPQLIMAESEQSPFGARSVPFRNVTGKFSLAAGEQATILIGYRSGGSSFLPLTIESEVSFLERRARDLVKNVIFYTTAVVMVLFSLVFMPAIRRRVEFAYAVYLSSLIVYVAHIDGYAFQFLWPDLPGWNAFASLPLGYGIAIPAAFFAREFLCTRTENRHIDMVFRGVIWTTVGLILSSIIVNEQWLKKFGFLYICVVTLIFIGCCLAILREHRPGIRYFTLGWLAIIVSAVFSALAHWSPGAYAVDASFDSMRLGVLAQALMFALAMAEQVRSYRRDRDSAMRREMRALEENVALERSRAYAQALADARSAQLASASHDLKQPLVSLRLMLRRAIGPHDSETVSAMRQSIDYLEGLVRRYLDEARGHTSAPAQQKGDGSGLREAFDISLILNNVTSMFADEARERGGKLRSVPSSARVAGDPMAVMRIVSNFVSNGVKHSHEGDVLLGCRRQENRLRIEIHDLGPGLKKEQRDRLLAAAGSEACESAAPNGGLGLMIALRMIRENGYGFDVRCREGRGSVFALILPLA